MAQPENVHERLDALEDWIIQYDKSRTFAQFWKDCRAFDPEIDDYFKNLLGPISYDDMQRWNFVMATADACGMLYGGSNFDRPIKDGWLKEDHEVDDSEVPFVRDMRL